MSAYDILLYSTVDEGASRRAFRTNISAATFQTGEPVIYQAANGLIDGQNGPGLVDPLGITGIALEPAVSMGNQMSALEVEDTLRLVELPDENKLFVARYFSTDGTGAALTTPTWANVAGQLGNLIYNNAAQRWSFDTASGNLNVEGMDVLDDAWTLLGDDLSLSTTGTMVVFRFT